MNENRYKIIDWAGNDKTAYYGLFDSFDNAWDALYQEFEHLEDKDFDEQMSEFEVVELDFN